MKTIMSDTAPGSSAPPHPVTLLLIACLLAVTGGYMMLHGLSLVDAGWLNPNPHVPPWVFTLIGVILLCGAWLTLGKVLRLPKLTYHIAGTACVGLSIVAMHWLAFFAKGGSCGMEFSGLGLEVPGFFCGIAMGAGVILLDAILLLVGLATLRSYLRT